MPSLAGRFGDLYRSCTSFESSRRRSNNLAFLNFCCRLLLQGYQWCWALQVFGVYYVNFFDFRPRFLGYSGWRGCPPKSSWGFQSLPCWLFLRSLEVLRGLQILLQQGGVGSVWQTSHRQSPGWGRECLPNLPPTIPPCSCISHVGVLCTAPYWGGRTDDPSVLEPWCHRVATFDCRHQCLWLFCRRTRVITFMARMVSFAEGEKKCTNTMISWRWHEACKL